MKIYLASMFADKDRIKSRAQELDALGLECTSRWADETVPHTTTIKELPDEYHRETAAVDLDDIVRAQKLVLTVPEDKMLVDAPIRSSSRGGRHFESGFIYGLICGWDHHRGPCPWELIVLGPRENVFHFLDGTGAAKDYPAIRQIATWEEVKQYLVEEKNRVERSNLAQV